MVNAVIRSLVPALAVAIAFSPTFLHGDDAPATRDKAPAESPATDESAKDEWKVIPVYDGVAPGSEDWKQQERESTLPVTGDRVVWNVVKPTLTVVPAAKDQATGAAAVICPGGAFLFLGMDHEGLDLAKFLAARGVTCFVLKYRTMEAKSDKLLMELLTEEVRKAQPAAFKISADDGLAAVKLVRDRAAEYGVDPKRTGIIGFSAGGMVATAAALRSNAAGRPAFAATIYGAYDPTDYGDKVPKLAPPLFICAAQDDQLRQSPRSVALYQAWTAAKRSAELHLYAHGGHGFGMRRQELPVDRWPERLVEWLDDLKMLEK
jgi:acetyl esterase/lipase